MLRVLPFIVLLSGCGGGQGISLMPYEGLGQGPEKFAVCHGFGCSHATDVKLSEKQWSKVVRPLARKAKNPAAERANIAKAVALMEKEVQKTANLNPDLAQAQTFEKDQHQMDCLDETINTSRYIGFFADKGFLHYHEAGEPLHRGYFIDGLWPHNTASVQEKATGAVFAIDSYYSDNGKKVYVVAKQDWLNKWRPEGLKPRVVPPKPQRKPVRKA